MKTYPINRLDKANAGLDLKTDYHALLTGELRPPRRGEWYLSGAIPEAYLARNDLSTSYRICIIVPTVDEAVKEDTSTDATPDHWENDPEFPVDDWQYEVAVDDTRLGYAEWVDAQREAKAAEIGSVWWHTNGNRYRVVALANEHTQLPEKYPVTVVYEGFSNGCIWARPLSDWHRSMKKDTNNG